MRTIYLHKYVFTDGTDMIVPGAYTNKERAEAAARELGGSNYTVEVISMPLWDEE